MKIAVLGAGAMGCLYGSLLADQDNEIWLIDVWKEHVNSINEKGLSIVEAVEEKVIKNIKATSNPSEVGIADIVIVFVKSTITDKALEEAQSIVGANTVVLTLQNGLGNIEKIASIVGKENILAGTTAHGANVLAPGRVKHAGIGKTIIGEINGKISDRVEKIAEIFNKCSIETIVSNNVLGLIWDKLLVNVGINALTALTGLRNGELIKYKETEEILELAVKEGVLIAQANDIDLINKQPSEHVKEVCKLTSENKSSMLQDILNNRKTEIDMINGAIVKEGKKHNIETPINLLLTNLVKIKEKNKN